MTTKIICKNYGVSPRAYSIPHHGFDTIIQGAWEMIMQVGTIYNFYARSTNHNDGDGFSQDIWLAGGTYTLEIIYVKANNAGIIDVYVDNNLQGSIDEYAAATSYDNSVQFTGISLAAGKHVLKFVVNGKNASSANHYCYLTGASWNITSCAQAARTSPLLGFDCVSPITILPFFTNDTTVVQGTISPLIAGAGWPYNLRPMQSTTDADGDGISFEQYLPKGVWTARLVGQIQANAGKVDFAIDGTTKGTFDLYNATTSYTTAREIVSISNTKNGFKTMTMITNGKNASSGGYTSEWVGLLLKKTAEV